MIHLISNSYNELQQLQCYGGPGDQTLFQKDQSAPLSWILITHFYNYDQSCTRLQFGDEKFGNYR